MSHDPDDHRKRGSRTRMSREGDCSVVGCSSPISALRFCGKHHRRFKIHGDPLRGPIGRKNHPNYALWTSMRQRCSNPKYPAFHLYGGAGVTVCDRWQIFENFTTDMGPRPYVQT